MPDFCDLAADAERRLREAEISAALHRRPGPGPGPEWIDGKPCCRECGEDIPRARLDAIPGCGLCVACAEEGQSRGAA